MKEYCPKHRKVEFVMFWVFKKNGIKKLVKLCPKCYSLINVKFICSKCQWENNLWLNKKDLLIRCERCLGTGVRGVPFISNRNIPNWRLNIDDTKPGEILKTSAEAFGMKPKSAEDWKAFYESEHEQEKLREFNEEKKKFTKEILGSPNFPIQKDTATL